MSVIPILIIICTLAYLHATNALLALIALILVEIGLTLDKLKVGVADLCQTLKDDDEPDIETVIQQFDDAVKRMEADVARETFAKPPSGPQTMQQAPHNWLEPGIKES